jgi:hypothetical protein
MAFRHLIDFPVNGKVKIIEGFVNVVLAAKVLERKLRG